MIFDQPMDTERDWPTFVARDDARERLADLVADPEAAQVVWDKLVAPLYDSLGGFRVYTFTLHCRNCGRPHPRSYQGQKNAAQGKAHRGHAMSCPHYVGPLEHRAARTEKAVLGWRLVCTCGSTYADEPNSECPDTQVDWRGPRPVE